MRVIKVISIKSRNVLSNSYQRWREERIQITIELDVKSTIDRV